MKVNINSVIIFHFNVIDASELTREDVILCWLIHYRTIIRLIHGETGQLTLEPTNNVTSIKLSEERGEELGL